MAVLATFSAALTVAVWPNGPGGDVHRHRVVCPGARVCAQLARAGRGAFAPVPQDAICTMVYGGPQQALVTGQIDGRRLRARFRRTNGCETARWQRLAFLFRA